MKNNTIQESDLEKQVTEDGSVTIARKESGLLYRSAHGAQQESTEVFVQGTKPCIFQDQWSVFELGFGTGMNFSTTRRFAHEHDVLLHYEAVDHLPVPSSFGTCIWTQKALRLVREKRESITIEIPEGSLTLHPYPFQEVQFNRVFNAIFHDPFGPGANPECWTTDCFIKEASILTEQGIWTSYGASGAMRRALAQSGFYVAVGPGIGKKRETTRASKCSDVLFPLKIKYAPPTQHLRS